MPEPTVQIPAGSVVITPVQMYDEMRATHEAVQRIEAALSPVPSQIADHELRLRGLEKFQWKAIGIATTVSTIFGVVSAYIAHASIH